MHKDHQYILCCQHSYPALRHFSCFHFSMIFFSVEPGLTTSLVVSGGLSGLFNASSHVCIENQYMGGVFLQLCIPWFSAICDIFTSFL